MKKKIKRIINNPFFSGSLVMVVGNNLFNLGQLIYHFLAGRILGKHGYGDLAVIISLLGIITIIQLAFGLTIVKFIASKKDKKEISNFIKWVLWWSIWVGAIAAGILFLMVPFIAKFLNIDQLGAIYLLSPMLFLLTISSNGRSILQGLLNFKMYVVSFIAEIIAKLTLTVFLVYLGLYVFGAMAAIFIGVLAGFVVVYFSLSKYLIYKMGERPNIMPMFKYSIAVFIQGVALTSMYSTDLLLVKHFFPAEEAGLYAALTVLGRIVFFGSSPIAHVMFPIISKRFIQKLDYRYFFYISLLLISLIAFCITIIYFFFPEIIITVLYGSAYLAGANILWWFGVFMGLLAVAVLLTQFYLSIGKTKITILFAIAATLQGVLIWFIHTSILQVVQISIVITSLLVLSLLVYFPYYYASQEKDKI